ncbi:hypothetical protein MT994_14920 [Cellulosimicrobium sp. MI9406]|uniref:hypothetical protein n=1 Tax=Cellulosimicrobium sp. MI9406 TaxID=2931398 RepID=UPI0033B24365
MVAVGAVLAAVAASLARIMAIPAVDAWLRHLGLSSTPTFPAVGRDRTPAITALTADERGAVTHLRETKRHDDSRFT